MTPVTQPLEVKEIRLRRRIDEIYADPASGSRYITAILRREGWSINRKRVVRCIPIKINMSFQLFLETLD
ncbi:transposase [Alicyclobacillus cycloheptanicus]|nr:transposase [Alicyclobacillus cycloheptanicus]